MAQDPKKERRNLKRRHIVFYLDIFDMDSGVKLGQLGDISIKGLLIIAKKPLPLEKEYSVKIMLPDVHGFSHEYIAARIHTCWSSPDVNPELFCTGTNFIELSQKDRESVSYLINVLGFQD